MLAEAVLSDSSDASRVSTCGLSSSFMTSAILAGPAELRSASISPIISMTRFSMIAAAFALTSFMLTARFRMSGRCSSESCSSTLAPKPDGIIDKT
ncbi:hypothetical protein D9M72_619850 [compost metagenome]